MGDGEPYHNSQQCSSVLEGFIQLRTSHQDYMYMKRIQLTVHSPLSNRPGESPGNIFPCLRLAILKAITFTKHIKDEWEISRTPTYLESKYNWEHERYSVYAFVAICVGHIWANKPFFPAEVKSTEGLCSQKSQILENTADECICEDPDTQILLQYLCFLTQ